MTDEMTARAIRSSWRTAEATMFSLGDGDVERYERAITLVRAVADELGGVDSTTALVDMWPDCLSIVRAAAERAELTVGSLPPEQIAGCAFAIRHAELHAEEVRRARMSRVAAARGEGADWVLLHESGDLLAGFADPYGSTRMHVASGLAIVARVQPDLTTGAAMRTLTVVRLDPTTGDLVDADPGVADVAYSDCASFRSGETALRVLVEEAAANQRIG